MASRLVLCALLVASASGAAPAAAQQSWIRMASVVGDYDPSDTQYSAGRGRLLPAAVNGAFLRASHKATVLAVIEGMHAGDSVPRQSEVEAAGAALRVIWQFDDGEWGEAKGTCRWYGVPDRTRKTAAPLVERLHVKVVATFCRDGKPATEAVGYIANGGTPGSAEFDAFIRKMTAALFP